MTVAERIWKLSLDKSISAEKLAVAVKALSDDAQRESKRLFDVAFRELQATLPEIGKHGELMRGGEVIAKFSRFEDIQRAIQPVLSENGFTLSRHNAFPRERCIEVLVVLSHIGGYHTENAFQLDADLSHDMNANQQMASSQSYAARYALAGLLNLILADSDDDGERSAPQPVEPSVGRPDGYDKTWKMLERAAQHGPKCFRRHTRTRLSRCVSGPSFTTRSVWTRSSDWL